MEAVLNLLNKYKLITEKIKQYITAYSTIHREAYTIIMPINNNIQIIENNINIILPTNLDEIDNIFFIENTLSIIEERILLITTILGNDIKLNSNNKLNLLDIEENYNWINRTVNSFLYFSEHENLIHIFLEHIKGESINNIEALYNKYNSTLKLYMHYLQLSINNTNMDNKNAIQEKIEKLKYNIINQTEIENKLYSHSLKHNLQRYNLFPVNKKLTEQGVINIILHMKSNNISGGLETKTITIENVRNKLESLHTIALEKRYGIFLMIRIQPNNVYYNFDIVNSIEKKSNTKGISSENIERYNFVEQKKNSYTNTLNSNIKFGYKNTSNWIILRTTDNNIYDIYGDNKKNIIHNKKTIDKIERGSSLIVDTYNKLNAFKFSKHINPIMPVVIDNNINFIRMVKNIILSLKTEVEQKINNGFTNINELYSTLSGDWISGFIQNKLLNELLLNNENISCSILNDITSLSSSILKFIEEDIARLEIDSDIFKQNTMNYIKNFAKKNIFIIITRSVEKSMPIESNLYDKINLRKSLLNIN